MYQKVMNYGLPLAHELIWSPDGKVAALLGAGGGVAFYNEDFEQTHNLQGHIEQALSLSWHPKGNFLVCSDRMEHDRDDKENIKHCVRIWEFKTGKQEQLLYEDSKHYAVAVLWSSDGQKIAAALYDGRILIWDGVSFQLLHRFLGHKFAPHLFWGKDDQTLISVSYDHTIKIWDSATAQLLQTIEGNSTEIVDVEYNSDSTSIIVTRGTSDTMRMRNIFNASSDSTFQIGASFYGYRFFRWSPDSKLILGQIDPNRVGIWDAATGRLKDKLKVMDEITALEWHPDNRRIIASTKTELIIWHIDRKPIKIQKYVISTPYEFLCWNPTGDKLAGISKLGYPQFWRKTAQGTLEAQLNSPEQDFGGLYTSALNHHSQQIALGYETGHIRIWDLATKQIRLIEGAFDAPIQQIFWTSPTALLIQSYPSSIAAFDLLTETIQISTTLKGQLRALTLTETGKILLGITVNPHIAFKLDPETFLEIASYKTTFTSAWNSTGTLLAQITDLFAESQVEIISVTENKLISIVELAIPEEQVSCMSWSPDSHYLVLGTTKGWIYLIDAAAQKLVSMQHQHEMAVSLISWCQTKPLFASGGEDYQVAIWNAERWQPTQTCFHTSLIMSLNWSDDGRALFIFGLDGTGVLVSDDSQ